MFIKRCNVLLRCQLTWNISLQWSFFLQVLSPGGSSRRERIKEPKEEAILVNILVEMQKRTEEKVGVTHVSILF